MNRKDIIRIAQECGYWSGQTVEMNDVGLVRFASLVASAEREACVKICEDLIGTRAMAWHCAEEIRARSKS